MTKLTIIAAVSGSYRRGGLDLSSGRTVVEDAKNISATNLKSLRADPRVTISEATPGDEARVGNAEKRIAAELATAKSEAAEVLKTFRTALNAAGKAGGKTKSDEQKAALEKAKADFATAKSVHDDAVKEAETTAADERKQLGLTTK